MLGKGYLTDRRGGIAPIFAIVMLVLVGVVFGAINLSAARTQKSRAQDRIDVASLAAVRLLGPGGKTDEEIVQWTKGYLASVGMSDPDLAKSTITIRRAVNEVEILYSGKASNTIGTALWDGLITVAAKSTARLGGATYPVCILITEPTDNHTLRASNGSKTDLTKCLVQVNTQNWDAVEAKDVAYIHINDGQNCYVGDIHFGDVKPEKLPTCDLFPDPFAGLFVNAPSKCDQTDFVISQNKPHSAPLTPGVYCGGLTIERDASFRPGVYYIKDGPLQISGSATDIDADGVTFLFSGKDAGLQITSGGKMAFSPAKGSVAGKFDGFVFYLDQSAATDPLSTSEITGAKVTMSGTTYFKGQHLIIGKNAKVTINPGSIVTGYLLPQGGDLNFTGALPTASAAAQGLQKSIKGGVARLVR